MIKNYIKVALRNILRRKGFSFINIIGLAMGMAVCILILLWVRDEYNYDRFNAKADSIYRVNFSYLSNNETKHHWRTPPPMARTIKEKYPEIEDAARFHNEGQVLVRVDNKKLKLIAGYTDNSLFNIFTLPFAQGDQTTALVDPSSAVISQKMADTFFPDENPIGKTISINNQLDLMVDGVLEPLPAGSHLVFDLLMSFKHLPDIMGYGGEDEWGDFGFNTFILLKKSASIDQTEKNINMCVDEIIPELGRKFYLQPLKKMHLYNLDGHSGRILYVYIFSSIALFILIIACINFMNLSTVRSMQRAREIGIRKVVGAVRHQLRVQFICESVMLSMIALLVAILMVELLMPIFNTLTGKALSFDIFNSSISLSLLFITLVTGLLSGLYPAFLLSSFKPVKVLKRNPRGDSNTLRKCLVVLQFTLSTILIFSTIVVAKQIKFIQNQNLGFNRQNVVYLPLNNDFYEHSDALKEELLKDPNILNVTRTSSKLGLGPKWSMTIENWEGNNGESTLTLPLISCDSDFLETFGLELVAGEFYTEDFYSQEGGFEFILNETAVKTAGIEDPIGKSFHNGTIKGVIKDFNFSSLHNNIDPLALVTVPEWDNHVAVKISGYNIEKTIKYIEEVSKKIAPEFLFEYSFLDSEFDGMYQSEIRLGKLFNYFALFAIIISCLGLLGLSSYMIQQRTKEIGLRKVLGSSVSGIIQQLSTQFIKWIILANIIALPIAYFIMDKWLQNFAFKTSISIYIFIVTGCIALLTSLITISVQTIRAAKLNPVDSIKYE